MYENSNFLNIFLYILIGNVVTRTRIHTHTQARTHTRTQSQTHARQTLGICRVFVHWCGGFFHSSYYYYYYYDYLLLTTSY